METSPSTSLDKDAATALDDVLAHYLAAEQEDYEDTAKAVMEAYEEVKAGNTIPADEVLEELRAKRRSPRAFAFATIFKQTN